MKTLRAMLVRFAGLFRWKQHEADMNEELRAHLNALIQRKVAAGMSPENLRRVGIFDAERARRVAFWTNKWTLPAATMKDGGWSE